MVGAEREASQIVELVVERYLADLLGAGSYLSACESFTRDSKVRSKEKPVLYIPNILVDPNTGQLN